MSEAFVDVSWRGLEVGKRVKLHAVHTADAYLDHAMPMPVGSQLAIHTDEGLEIAATVVRVHEQVGGSTEVPGMQIVPRGLAGEAQAWWAARVEGIPVDPRAAITSRPTLTMSSIELERAVAAAAGNTDASSTEIMTAVADPDAVVDGVVETTASDDGLVDDGRRTMVMSALDISAVVEAAEAETSGPIGDDDGPSGDGPSGDGNGSPAGKRKRSGGRRGKKR